MKKLIVLALILTVTLAVTARFCMAQMNLEDICSDPRNPLYAQYCVEHQDGGGSMYQW